PNTAKRLEDSWNILRGNATPVIADMKHGDVGTAFACHDDLARAVGGEVGDRIRQEIPHDLFQGCAISHHGGQRIHGDLHLVLRDLVCQSLYRLLYERSHIEWLQVEVTAAQTRQVQDGPDEVIHTGDRGLNKAQGFGDVLVKDAADVCALRRLQVWESR